VKDFITWALSIWPILLGIFTIAIAASTWIIKHDFGHSKEKRQNALILTPLTYAIGLSSMTDYPKEPENAYWLCLEVFVSPIEKPIDTLDIIIDDKTIPANQWHGKIVTATRVYFNVTEWQRKGNRQVELVAYVDKRPHSSGRFPVDFNVEPFGKHNI